MKRINSSKALGYTYSSTSKRNLLSPDMKNLCSCDAARLEDELTQLRESTKLALKSSWDEVEVLQNTNSSQTGTISNLKTEIAKLNEELNTARDREKDLSRRNGKLISKLAASRKAPLFKTVFSAARRRSADTVTQNINNTMHDFRHDTSHDPIHPGRNSMLRAFKMESFSTPQLGVHNDTDEDSSTTASSTGNNKLDFLGPLDDTTHSYPSFPSRRKIVSFEDAKIITTGKILPVGRRLSADDSNLRPASLVLPISSKTSPSPVAVPATPSKVLNLDNRSQEMEKESISDDEKDMKIEELKLQLKSRDNVINSMEETMTVHIKNMQQLHVTCGTSEH